MPSPMEIEIRNFMTMDLCLDKVFLFSISRNSKMVSLFIDLVHIFHYDKDSTDRTLQIMLFHGVNRYVPGLLN